MLLIIGQKEKAAALVRMIIKRLMIYQENFDEMYMYSNDSGIQYLILHNHVSSLSWSMRFTVTVQQPAIQLLGDTFK